MRNYLKIKNALIAATTTALTSGWLDLTAAGRVQRAYILIMSFVFMMCLLKRADRYYIKLRKERA